MTDETNRRFERVEDRLEGIEGREAARDVREGERDVKVDLMTSVMNRLTVAVLTVGTSVVGMAVWVILKGGPH